MIGFGSKPTPIIHKASQAKRATLYAKMPQPEAVEYVAGLIARAVFFGGIARETEE